MKGIFPFFLLFLFISCCKEQEKAYYKPHLKKDIKKKIHLQRATLYIGSQSYSLAEREIKEAIKADPEDYKSWFMLGKIYDEMNENEKAINAYIVGIKLKRKTKDEIGTSSLRNPFQPVWKRKDNSKP